MKPAAATQITTLNLSLPEAMREWVQTQVASGSFSSASEYLRSLIRDDQKRRAAEKLEQMLLDGLKGGAVDMTAEDWQEIRGEVRKRLNAKRKG